jgi:hypothetical protein
MKEFGWFIKDNLGCFGGSLGLSVKEDGTGLEWGYTANRNANRWHSNKQLAIAEVERLEELNKVAGFEGLTWELVYANYEDFPIIEGKNFPLINLMHKYKNIPQDYIRKHEKAVLDINKRYKTIFKEIEREWRANSCVEPQII